MDGSRPVPVTTTSAPMRANTLAVARPIPRNRPAPVTIATLPLNSRSEPVISIAPGILDCAYSQLLSSNCTE